MNNDKYIQNTMVLNVNTYTDKNGETKFNYICAVRTYNKNTKIFEPELVIVNGDKEYKIGEEIAVKGNINRMTGKVFYTLIKEIEDNFLAPIE